MIEMESGDAAIAKKHTIVQGEDVGEVSVDFDHGEIELVLTQGNESVWLNKKAALLLAELIRSNLE